MKSLWNGLKQVVSLVVGFFIMLVVMSFFAIGGAITYIISLFRKGKVKK